jgi:DNA-binding NarL/FixJ family response regulator
MTRPRVLLADDHRIVAEGLKNILSEEFDLTGTVEDGKALLEAVEKQRPDVIVADISMPRLNGIEALVELKKRDVGVRVVFLTMHRNVSYARRALEAGASGYVLKHSAATELVDAIRAALEGRSYVSPMLAAEVIDASSGGQVGESDRVATLTPRQREILQLLAEGRSAKEIGDLLSISPRTVEFHKYQMMEAIEIRTSAELILFAIKHGIVSI